MALPTTGDIALSQIISEFGGPENLIAYYRGGAYVPNISQNANVPTSGIISVTNFYGATTSEVVITAATYSSTATTGNNAGTQITFCSNGVLQIEHVTATTTTLDNISGEWLVAGSATSYQIDATLVTSNMTGGSTVTGSFGVFENMNTSPIWFVTAPANHAVANANILFQIRTVSPATVVANAYISLTAVAVFAGD
jgi:hypothetical protein